MKKLSLALLAGVAFAGTASAADLPRRAAPPVIAAPVYTAYNWSGFYLGIQGGWLRTESDAVLTNAAGAFPIGFSGRSDDWTIGGHVGFNAQFGSFVAGVEGDLEYVDVGNSRGGSGVIVAGGAPLFYQYRNSMDWQGSVRARLGFAVDRALIYATGGVAFADMDNRFFGPAATAAGPFVALGGTSDTRIGWTLGAGVEYAFTDNLTARVEYRYTDFENESFSNVALNAAGRSSLETHAVRVGLTYKFGGMGGGIFR